MQEITKVNILFANMYDLEIYIVEAQISSHNNMPKLVVWLAQSVERQYTILAARVQIPAVETRLTWIFHTGDPDVMYVNTPLLTLAGQIIRNLKPWNELRIFRY